MLPKIYEKLKESEQVPVKILVKMSPQRAQYFPINLGQHA